MKPKRFRAPVLAGHKEDAVDVPFDPAEAWGAALESFRPGRRGYGVAAAINDAPFESFVVGRSRRLYLLIPAGVLQDAGAAVGDTVRVALSPRASGAAVEASRPRTSRTPRKTAARPRRG